MHPDIKPYCLVSLKRWNQSLMSLNKEI